MDIFSEFSEGNNILVCMFGIEKGNDELSFIIDEALKKDSFQQLGRLKYDFMPGFSELRLISESHSSINTYPEYKSMVFNIYTCRKRMDGRQTIKHMVEELNPKKILILENPVPAHDVILKSYYQYKLIADYERGKFSCTCLPHSFLSEFARIF